MRSKTLFLLAVGIAATVGVVPRQAIAPSILEPTLSIPVVSQRPAAKPAPSPEEIAGPHLRWADDESAKFLDEHLRQIDLFIADSKKRTPEFADRALSWSSKWRLAADWVPFTKGGRNEAYLRGQFEELIFKPSQLSDLIEQTISSYMAHLRSLEGEVLVRVRADTADFSQTYRIADLDEAQWETRYDEALLQAVEATGGGIRSDVATQLVSLIAGEVLTQAATRLGISAGILGTGAASSWATFGVGLVVGLIVDQIVSWVWDWYADPVGSLSAQLDEKLDALGRLVVDGSEDMPGLRSRLMDYTKHRAQVRRTAVLALLENPVESNP